MVAPAPVVSEPAATDPPKKEETAKEKAEREKKEKEELSEEDQKLKSDLEMLMQRLAEDDQKLYKAALESMRDLIRTSTQSMTSVPKPLKYMRPHYQALKDVHGKIKDDSTQKYCSSIISVLAMTSDDSQAADCLTYRLKGALEPIGDWGLEFVRHLCVELVDEWRKLDDSAMDYEPRMNQLLDLAKSIVAHQMTHNAEIEACDLLMEIDKLVLLQDHVDEEAHSRVCLYLINCVPYLASPESETIQKTVRDIYLKFNRNIEALRVAVMMSDLDKIKHIVVNEKNKLVQRQMAIILGRQQLFIDFEELLESAGDEQQAELCAQLNNNQDMSTYFKSLCRELDIMEPKSPDDIYKTHLEPQRAFGQVAPQPDSSKKALADSFTNAFVNAGFGTDKLVTPSTDDAHRTFLQAREYGTMSASASQGLLFKGDVDGGLAQADRFLYVDNDYVKAGALMSVGLSVCGINDPVDPAAGLLIDYVQNENAAIRVGSIMGLAMAYVNSKRESIYKDEEGSVLYELRQVVSDEKPSATAEAKAMAALAMGLISVGSADVTTSTFLLQTLMQMPDDKLKEPATRWYALALALCFLGKQEQSEAFVESVQCVGEPIGSMAALLIDACSYAGTGNVLKIQKMLHICTVHEDKDKDEAKEKEKTDKDKAKSAGEISQQSVAALAIGVIAMGEDIGSQMLLRTFAHLIRYGEPAIRQAVPLALALLSVSNPQLSIIETLSKFSHDTDPDTARNAIIALGIVGAGTNNARMSTMLRQLAVYHSKDAMSLMLVRIAQGLTHMGKGTMSLNAFHSDRQLMNTAAVAGLITCSFAFLDAKNAVLNGRQHYLMYTLCAAMQPRMLITLVDNPQQPGTFTQINVHVRVGQAVDSVGQAGKPKTITGFRTHTTPVLLAFGERAELATDEYKSVTPYMEGLVILEKNPDFTPTVIGAK